MKFNKNLLLVVSMFGLVSISGCTQYPRSNRFIGTWELKGPFLSEETSIAKATFGENTVVIMGVGGMGSGTYKIVNDSYLLITDNKRGESYKWYYEFVDDNTVIFWGEGGEYEKTVWRRIS